MRQDLSPEDIRRLRGLQTKATAIADKISAAVAIDDLGVAFSATTKTVSLAGTTTNEEFRRKAEEIAAGFEDVEHVTNGIQVTGAARK